MSLMLFALQLLWLSVKRLNSISTLSIFKMAVAAILDFVKTIDLNNLSENTSPMLLSRKIWWQSVQRSNSYITFCSFTRWRSPPSWILWKFYIWPIFRKKMSPMLLACKIWWQSVEWFKSYGKSSFFKMAVTAILNCVIWPYPSFYVIPICEL